MGTIRYFQWYVDRTSNYGYGMIWAEGGYPMLYHIILKSTLMFQRWFPLTPIVISIVINEFLVVSKFQLTLTNPSTLPTTTTQYAQALSSILLFNTIVAQQLQASEWCFGCREASKSGLSSMWCFGAAARLQSVVYLLLVLVMWQ